jgi:hypothetical protein
MHLPLVVGTSMAAIRLNSPQGRWAQAIMLGRGYVIARRLTSHQRFLLRQDLGWLPLWHTAVVAAIVLKQKNAHSDPRQVHARWMSRAAAPPGTWASQVEHLPTRFGIPNIALPPLHRQMPPLQLNRLFVAYRKLHVAPAVAAGLCCTRKAPPLPWGWIALVLTTGQLRKAFALWWHLRVCQVPPPSTEWQACPMCHLGAQPLLPHLLHHYDRFSQALRAEDLLPELFLQAPTTPEELRAQLRLTTVLIGGSAEQLHSQR